MILIRKPGLKWHAPQITAYANEEALKMLLAQSPDLIPGVQDNKMAVVTEMPVPVTGDIDLLGVDLEGNITVVECKLKSNPEIRREVVGQIFAYAAGLWKLTYEAFDKAFTNKAGVSLAQAVAALDPEMWDEETFRANVATNLADGRFRLVLAVDKITDEFKRAVLYLNEHTVADLQILALELGYIADEGVEILLPAVYGEESAQAKAAGGSATRKWDEASMFATLEEHCAPMVVQAMRELYSFARDRGAELRFGTTILPSVTVRLPLNGAYVSAFNLSEYPQAEGCLSVYFGALDDNGIPSGAVSALADRLLEIPGVVFKTKKAPTISIDACLTQPNSLDKVREAFDALMQTAPGGAGE